MNEQTLKKLKNNPHYKLSQKQQQELAQVDRKPMVKFNTPKVHNSQFAKHDVKVVKKSKDEKEKSNS